MKSNYFQALEILLFGFLGSGFLLNLLAEMTGRFVTSPVFVSLVLGSLIVGVEYNSRDVVIRQRHCVIFGLLWFATSFTWLLALSVDLRAFITFLGYGYDNAAHFTLGRMILDHGHSFLLSSDPTAGPTFLQDAAQLGGTTFSSTATIMGVSNSNLTGLLATFSLITISIPILAVASVTTGAHLFIRKYKIVGAVLVMVAASVFVMTGYLSRIWTSGYLNSNLGTLCLMVLMVHVSLGPTPNLPILVVGVCVMTHSYPLFMGFGLALLLPALVRSSWVSFQMRGEHRMRRIIRLTVGTGLPFVTLIFPYIATRRSYGGSQFLAEGGIEPFPSNWFLMVCLLVGPLLCTIALGASSRVSLSSLFLIGTIAGSAAVYSIVKVDKIAYYPTKFLIAFLLACTAFLIVSPTQIRSTALKWTSTVLLGLVILIYGFFKPRELVFTTPFMGDFPQSINAARHATPVIVEGGRIYALALQSKATGVPLLYLARDQESELNTRWINAISGSWTDTSWTNWMQSRSFLTAEAEPQSPPPPTTSKLIVVTDDAKVASRLKTQSSLRLCFIKPNYECG